MYQVCARLIRFVQRYCKCKPVFPSFSFFLFYFLSHANLHVRSLSIFFFPLQVNRLTSLFVNCQQRKYSTRWGKIIHKFTQTFCFIFFLFLALFPVSDFFVLSTKRQYFLDRGKSNIIVKKERGNGASGVFLYSNLFVLVKKYSVAA